MKTLFSLFTLLVLLVKIVSVGLVFVVLYFLFTNPEMIGEFVANIINGFNSTLNK